MRTYPCLAADSQNRLHRPGRRWKCRHGAAAVEFAMVAPVLVLFFAFAADYSRAFYQSQILTSAARNGAVFASDIRIAQAVPENEVNAIVRATLGALANDCQIETKDVLDAAGHRCAEVSVTYTFRAVIALPGLGRQRQLHSTVRMRLTPATQESSDDDENQS